MAEVPWGPDLPGLDSDVEPVVESMAPDGPSRGPGSSVAAGRALVCPVPSAEAGVAVSGLLDLPTLQGTGAWRVFCARWELASSSPRFFRAITWAWCSPGREARFRIAASSPVRGRIRYFLRAAQECSPLRDGVATIRDLEIGGSAQGGGGGLYRLRQLPENAGPA